MLPAPEHRDAERERFAFFTAIPPLDRDALPHDTVKGSQVLQPLFSFSSACAGCGETPYLKLLTQLFGDRILVANATGCSSIYGGNLPTTPWSANGEGRGPAWANSLFEDNAEFGLGLRLGVEQQPRPPGGSLAGLGGVVGDDLVRASSTAPRPPSPRSVPSATASRSWSAACAGSRTPRRTSSISSSSWARWCARTSGSSAATAGPTTSASAASTTCSRRTSTSTCWCSTPRCTPTPAGRPPRRPRAPRSPSSPPPARPSRRRTSARLAMQYGTAYVAQIAMGANEVQTVRALLEAAAHPGPSLVLAYSTCIAHGFDMRDSMTHQRDAVKSGYWPLYRFRPTAEEHGKPFRLDSRKPAFPVATFARSEARFAMLERSDPERAAHLMALAQADVDERWRYYEQLAGVERSVAHEPGAVVDHAGAGAEEVV